VPRDFLRLFVRTVQATKELPLLPQAVRRATHDHFQTEKVDKLHALPKARALFEQIFEKTCLPAESWAFFVSERYGDDRRLQELWHHRLIHNLYEGYIAWVGKKAGTYDIYVLDYGRYVTMRASKKGEEVYATNRRIFSVVLKLVDVFGLGTDTTNLNGMLDQPEVNARVREYFDRAAAASLDIKPIELEKLASDCSSLVIDAWLADEVATKSKQAARRGRS